MQVKIHIQRDCHPLAAFRAVMLCLFHLVLWIVFEDMGSARFLTWMLWISLPRLQQCMCLFIVLAFRFLFTLLMRKLFLSFVEVIVWLSSKKQKTIGKTKVSPWIGVFQVKDVSVRNCRLDGNEREYSYRICLSGKGTQCLLPRNCHTCLNYD